ncbi:MAG TPA: lipopolysaccharide kinase InaA family protein [Actinoplanes sp.]|nr:lipopolysaccharide kinase InaA family protein [Actinoplanes sp.]
MTFAEAVEAIVKAGSFADLAAAAACSKVRDAGPASGDLSDAYHRLVKLVHPDAAPAGQSATATAAFAKLSVLWAERATTRKRIATGDIADLYAHGAGRVLKLPRSPADNDLMAAEAHALRTLHATADPKYRAYAPRLIESVTYEDGSRVRRTVNVLERLDGFVSLADISRRIDPRDAAWMWRRLLVALGWAHRAGIVHGAVLPAHILIHPQQHGVVLVDWCYSVAPGMRIAALVANDRDLYPPEVTAREGASAATDIYMATAVMRRLLTSPPAEPPRRLRRTAQRAYGAMTRFADGCLYDAPRMRPQDAWRLLAEFDELLDDLYGRRTFRPFTL